MNWSLLASSYGAVFGNVQVLLMTFLGALGGVLLGAIPGMTATMGVALLIPFSFGMDLIPSIGLLLGTVAGVIVAILTNVFLIFPAYMALYGMDWAAIVQMCTAVNPWITNVPTMVAFSIVPFNVISFGVTSILTMLLYKKISVPLKKFAMIG